MRESLAHQRPAARTGAADRVAAGGLAAKGTTAVLVATAAGDDGGPAALLAWEETTLLARLVEQLDTLGVADVRVLTRSAWVDAVTAALALAGPNVLVVSSPDTGEDLRVIAEIGRERDDAPLVVLYGDIVTHREALAGVLADPRQATAILSTGARTGRPFAMRTRSRRGRVTSAGSAYHHVQRSTMSFLGVLKVGPDDREPAAGQAERLAEIVADPPAAFTEEMLIKQRRWRHSLARTVLGHAEEVEALAPGEAPADGETPAWHAQPGEPIPPEVLDAVELPGDVCAELDRRVAAAPEDSVSLVVVGLVRGGSHVGHSYLRSLFWARPLSAPAVAEAQERIVGYDEDRVLLDSAVKASDGFFTTFFVSPYSRYIARWTARRGLTPNQVTVFSLALGFLSAAAFATGERWGLIAGAVLLQLAFTFDCVDGQLARYSRQFSKLGAWLDSIFDRTKEYVVFAGLAIGGTAMGESVWLLAGVALTLQTMRHMGDFSFGVSQQLQIGATQHAPLDWAWDGTNPPAVRWPPEAVAAAGAPAAAVTAVPPPPLRIRVARGLLSGWHRVDRLAAARWVKKIVAFPIGERFAAISLTAAIWNPRVTFLVLIVWGGFAAVYTLTGRLLRSLLR
ncbi:MAG: CDP-alcohol phosphatidyltransferase family protein [Solirubrobacteraceae bacterium]